MDNIYTASKYLFHSDTEYKIVTLLPTDVPVWKVTTENMDGSSKNKFVFDLKADIHGAGGSVSGNRLWKVGVWASAKADGKGARRSYIDQVKRLTQDYFVYFTHAKDLPTGIPYFLNY